MEKSKEVFRINQQLSDILDHDTLKAMNGKSFTPLKVARIEIAKKDKLGKQSK